MKKKIIFVLSLLLFLFLIIIFSEKTIEETEEVYVEKNIQEMSSSEVDRFLEEIKDLTEEEKLEKIVTSRIGTPYVGGCLGEESGVDTDPIFRLDVTDCTVFILTTAALLNSSNIEEARDLMGSLNYYPAGSISYEDRLHFTTYRNHVSPYFEEITEEIGVVETKSVTLNKIKEDGKRLIDIDFEETIEIKYIPSLSREDELPYIVGVAFLRDGDEEIGLDVRHEGVIINGEELIHASINKGEVVREDLFQYLQTAGFDGLIIFKIKLL